MMFTIIRRFGVFATVAMMLGVSVAQRESVSAPQAVFTALVTGDRTTAALTYPLLGDPVTALAHAQNIVQPSVSLRRHTAELAIGLRRWSLAQTSLENLLIEDNTSTWAHHQLGLLIAHTDKQTALNHLRAAWELDMAYAEPELIGTLTDNTDARTLAFQVGTVLADRSYYALAERAFADSTIFAPSPAESLASVGLMRALQGLDYAPWLTQAQALAPTSPEVYTLSGLTYRAARLYFDSLNAFIVALNLAPLDPEINAQLAESYALINDTRSAAFWYGQASALSGGDSRYKQAYEAAQTAIPPSPTLAP